MTSFWFLLVWVALAAGLGRVPAGTTTPWSRWDVAAALLAGVGFAVACGWWFPRYHLALGTLTASDFSQYCEAVYFLREGRPDLVSEQRSWYAALLPAGLATRFGVIGGLAVAAAICSRLLGSALWLWGRAVHGRLAGAASVVLGAAIAPVVLIARTASFYPESIAANALACAGAALCVRFPGVGSALFTGIWVGVALLMDVRGLYWALAATGVAVVGLIRGRWTRWPARWAALIAPIAASWWIGYHFVSLTAPGLGVQTRFFVNDALQLAGRDAPAEVAGVDFLWGRTSPLRIPEALQEVRRLTDQIPETLRYHGEVRYARKMWVIPPMMLAGLAAIAIVARRYRHPRDWLALAPLVPYAVSLYTAANTLAHPRYLAVGLAGLPLVLGVGWAAAVEGRGGLLPERWRAPAHLVLLGLLVIGVIPSWLSPIASWRMTLSAEGRVAEGGGSASGAQCHYAHVADQEAGRVWEWPGPVLTREAGEYPAGSPPR